MDLHKTKPLQNWRLILLGLAFLAGLCLLGVRLYDLQVVQSDLFEQRQVKQSVRRVLLPSPRGRILDRQGRLLADNQPNYCIALYVEELRRPGRWSNTIKAVDEELDRLAAVLQTPRTCSRERVREHIERGGLPLPLIAWEHVNDAMLARLTDSRERFPGVDVFVQPERFYPQGNIAAHVLGFVGRGDLSDAARSGDYQYHLEGMKGRGGVEREYDERLCGLPGGQLIRVDAVGYRHDEWLGRQPVPGQDIELTLDLRVQTVMEQALSDVRGAGVVLDPRNGEVLALASAPTFNPNDLSPAPSPRKWHDLINDLSRPLLNRAISGGYPPGSTFKPFVALAAQARGHVSPATTHVCEGTFWLGNRAIHCANGECHGTVDLRKAIEVSCNVYFCTLARDIGFDGIQAIAEQAGFGRRTGLDLPGETTGLLPTPEWKQSHYNERWSVGDTCNTAIGQGMLVVSPLQMAVAVGAVATGGTLVRPHVLRRPPTAADIAGHADWPTQALEVVRGGMLDVVSGEEGTGHRARVAGVNVAAKTGTAQYRTEEGPRKYGWMIAFAPAEAPRVALAMVVEEAQTGGLTVGPRLQRVLLAIFGDEIAAGKAGAT